MIDFNVCYKLTVNEEGCLVNDKDDPGGITNAGISLRFLKSCSLKYDFDGNGIIDEREIINLTEEQKKLIYKQEFFDKIKCHLINEQSIANYIFDTAVNCGIQQAIKIAQRAVWSTNIHNMQEIKDDGIIGEKTIKAINKIIEQGPLYFKSFMSSIRSERAGFYRILLNNNKKNVKYIQGWINRAYTFGIINIK